jgi:acyl-CoA synthetase (AMP-forming)/AMP-acid ligase II
VTLTPGVLDVLRRYEQPEDLCAEWFARGFYDDAVAGPALTAMQRRWPWRTAVIDGEQHLTHSEIDRAADSMAAALRDAGLEPGDVVSWQAPNWWESIVIALATWRVGAINNPVLPIYREHELGQILEDLRPEVIVAPKLFRGMAHHELLESVLDAVGHQPLLKVSLRGDSPGWTAFEALASTGRVPDAHATVSPDAPCVIAYTSGTTARAKGVVVSSRQFMAETRQMAGIWGIGWDDTTFMPAPLAHLTGMTVGLSVPFSVGGAVVLMDTWEPERGIAIAEAERAVFSSGTPTFLEEICNAYEQSDVARAALRQFSVGGAVVPPTLIERCDEIGISAFRCYGMTEHLSTTIMNAGYPLEIRRDTDGPVAPGSEVICIDEGGSVLPAGETGEMRVRGPERMIGYVNPADNEPVLDPAEGWFSTGDIGFVDERGCVHFSGRTKDIINRGGEKFSAREMEDVICRHPAIRQVAVVPAPDQRLGEVPAAFLVLRENVSPPASGELASFVAEQGLAKQKTPTAWHFVDRLPTTPFGKVRKQELIARLES